MSLFKGLRGLALGAAALGAVAVGVVVFEAPTGVGFAISVSLACGWCYWLEKKSDVS